MTYDPLTGPPNGIYSNSTSAFKIDDYSLTPTSGDVYTGKAVISNSGDLTYLSSSISSIDFGGLVTTQTFEF